MGTSFLLTVVSALRFYLTPCCHGCADRVSRQSCAKALALSAALHAQNLDGTFESRPGSNIAVLFHLCDTLQTGKR